MPTLQFLRTKQVQLPPPGIANPSPFLDKLHHQPIPGRPYRIKFIIQQVNQATAILCFAPFVCELISNPLRNN